MLMVVNLWSDGQRPAIILEVEFDRSVSLIGTNGPILELSSVEALTSLQALTVATNSAIQIRLAKGFRLLSASEQGAILHPISNFCSRMNAKIASVHIHSGGLSGALGPNYDSSWRYSLTNLLPWLPVTTTQ